MFYCWHFSTVSKFCIFFLEKCVNLRHLFLEEKWSWMQQVYTLKWMGCYSLSPVLNFCDLLIELWKYVTGYLGRKKLFFSKYWFVMMLEDISKLYNDVLHYIIHNCRQLLFYLHVLTFPKEIERILEKSSRN